MDIDRRLMPRYDVVLPIVIGGVQGTTRNVGVAGVRFAAPVAFPLEQSITFSVTLSASSAIDCTGIVKRATRLKDGQFEIVATIETLDLKPLPRP
jgi:hypothetical protein